MSGNGLSLVSGSGYIKIACNADNVANINNIGGPFDQYSDCNNPPVCIVPNANIIGDNNEPKRENIAELPIPALRTTVGNNSPV